MPISDVNTIDAVGVRKDGGLDLVISCGGPLDASPETVEMLRLKLQNYLHEIVDERPPTLRESYNRAPDSKIRILISCESQAESAALSVVEAMRVRAEEHGVEVLLIDVEDERG